MLPNPPSLFRVASDESRGCNTVDKVDPLDGYKAEYHSDFASIPFFKARCMIYDHINYEYKAPLQFSSWSVPLLYVLAHAARQFDGGDHSIRVYIMDTTKLSPANGCHGAAALVKCLKLTDWKKLQLYTRGEYVVHGKLSNSRGL